MRIRTLTIAGFGPYKTEQTIDFERFDDDGIFLITGKTGAGKSTILDAICFALYSSVPRYDGTQSQLRSDHAEPGDPTFVRLEFTVNDIDYRVERSPDYARPKKNGSGTTVQPHRAELSRRSRQGDDQHDGSPDTWETIAAKPIDVANELAAILPLSKDQFLQVILLAQNRFQEFLLAKNDARQSVLRTLFGTRRFERVEERLNTRRQRLKAELEASTAAILHRATMAAALVGAGDSPDSPDSVGVEWYDAALARLEERLTVVKAEALLADAALSHAESELAARSSVQTRQSRRTSALEALRALEAQSDSVELDRSAAEAARRAASVWPLVRALRVAEVEAAEAAAREADARSSYPAGDGTSASAAQTTAAQTTAAELSAVLDDRTQQLGALASVRTEEARLTGLDAELARLAAELSAMERSLVDADEKREEAPKRLSELAASISADHVLSAREPDARATVDRLEGALDAARSEAELVARQRSAHEAEAQAGREHATAARQLEALLDRRLGGQAAELASLLVDGEACAVCGSKTHPSPASAEGEPVTDQLVREARARVDECWASVGAAADVTSTIASLLVEARTRAGNKSVEALQGELAEAHDALIVATTARDRIEGLEAQHRLLLSDQESLESQSAELRANRDELTRQHGDASARRAAVVELRDAHLDGFVTVAERATHLEQELAATRALLGAIDTAERRRAAVVAAAEAARLEAQAQDFAHADDAAEARIAEPQLEQLEASIRRHDQSVATATTTLADPELAGLPEEPADVDAARTARDDCRQERDSALASVRVIEERFGQLSAIAAAAQTEFAETAALREEYRQVHELANAVQGLEPNTKRMRLESYVLAAQLEEIVAAANTRLKAMSYGRYSLEHDDSLQYRNTSSGLGLSIRDEHTGRSRATHSLSGGETFLASLALALGLAEVVSNQAGGITLDTLFVDEGFGSLDSETLATAMATLDGLRAGGRTVGLISHVDAMKEQIPAKLRITVSPEGYSVIETQEEAAQARHS